MMNISPCQNRKYNYLVGKFNISEILHTQPRRHSRNHLISHHQILSLIISLDQPSSLPVPQLTLPTPQSPPLLMLYPHLPHQTLLYICHTSLTTSKLYKIPQPQPTRSKLSLVILSPMQTLIQYIPTAHIATHERYVPPTYVAGEPTFTAPVMVNVPYQIDQYVEMQKEARSKEDKPLSDQLCILRNQMKNLQVAQGSNSLDCEDL